MSNLDSTSKRRSSCGILQPWQATPPSPDGTLDLEDRLHIAFSYSGIPSYSVVSASNAIVIIESVSVGAIKLGSAGSSVAISETVNGYVLQYQLSSTIVITESLIKNEDIANELIDTITIQEDVFGKFTVVNANVQSIIHIDEEAIGRNEVQFYSLSNSISIQERASETKIATATSAVSISETVSGSKGLATTIIITESVNIYISKRTASVISIIETLTTSSLYLRALSNTINIQEGVFGYNPRTVVRHPCCN